MISAEAKKILLAHRPGHETEPGADVLAALEQTRRDPDLQQWWMQQQSFHAAMEQGFAQAPVPEDLPERILARAKIIPLPWWREPRTWAAAAAIILLAGLAVLLWKPAPENSFATYRSRMVRGVLRQYRMDIQTNDMATIKQFLATNSAPDDYMLPPKLAKLPLTGAGLMSWQGSRVSMVCLDSGAQGTMFLFIAERSAVRQVPEAGRDYAAVNQLMTVSWTEGGKVYVLAGTGERETLERYF